MENITIQVDEQLKARAEALFAALGLDLSTATALFYRQALRYKGLPFDIRLAADEEIHRHNPCLFLKLQLQAFQSFVTIYV